MTYRVYIRKDYKPVIRIPRAGRNRQSLISRMMTILLMLTTALIVGMRSHEPVKQVGYLSTEVNTAYILPEPDEISLHPIEPVMQSLEPTDDEVYQSPFAVTEESSSSEATLSHEDIVETVIPDNWESLKVSSGDSLSVIFDRMQLSPRVLHEIMSIGKDVATLKRLMPDHEIRFQLDEGDLSALQYEINLTDTLHVTKKEDSYVAETVVTDLDTKVKQAYGIIEDSLFLTAQRAGISDNLIMQMVELYGWDIDFALDIRKGDRFFVIYEEKYKDGIQVQQGPILSAEFVNRGKSFRSVRYTHEDGYSDYYNENGFSMRKAFLRTPLKFSRISSRFSLGRKHPILNTIRAHRGVDYAAPTGTPIKATGDGIVEFAGNKGGYGRVIVIRHGEKYASLYGHLSKFANGTRAGKRVKQGQIIGYVGMSGLATGPHLHYEFRVNNIHRNPLTVELPKVVGIPADKMKLFREKTSDYFTQLDRLIRTASKDDASSIILAEKNSKQEGSKD